RSPMRCSTNRTSQSLLTESKGGHICVKNEVHSPARDPDDQRIQRIVLTSLGSEPVAEPEEVFLVDGVQHSRRRSLDDLVLECRNRQRTLFPISLRYVRPARWQCPVRSPVNPTGLPLGSVPAPH